jgi:hypothetical protein
MMTVTKIYDRGMRSPVEITGTLIGHGSSRRDGSPAWADVEVYRLDGGGFLVHRIGMSLVFHRADTTCATRDGRQRGDPAGVSDLPDDAEPCRVCAPPWPEDLPDGEAVIRFEFPRHAFDGCDSPEQVAEKLTVIRHRDKTRSVQFSQPVNDCLEECAANDPAFAKFLPGPVRFGG